jgi:quercetin dioxygenase-like cupin family protein
MCDNHTHHHHDEEQPSIREAVDAAYDKFYDGNRTYVREVTTDRYDYKDVWEKLREPDRRVVRGSEIPLKAKTSPPEGAQTWGKNLVRPWTGITQSLQMHFRVLGPEGYGKKHAHQNEALMYILDGEGYEIHDGEEYKWEAGDLAVIEGGTVHRHYSTDPENLCKALIVKPKGMYQFLHLLYQGFVENYPTDPASIPDWTPDEFWSAEGQQYHADE